MAIYAVEPSPKDRTVGGMHMAGDATFDADSIVNSDANHWQWLSYPGARLVLNPSPNDTTKPGPPGKDLPLNLGGWVGTETHRLTDINQIRVSAGDAAPEAARSLSTTWAPYKYGWTGEYARGIRVTGCDLFKDVDSSLIRYMKVEGSSSKIVELSGNFAGNQGGQWVGNPQPDTLLVRDSDYYYALRFVHVDGSKYTEIPQKPNIGNGQYSLRILLPEGSSELAMGFGFATRSEGRQAAITRATNCFGQSIATSLNDAKGNIESYLKRVPRPAAWGVQDVASRGVTPAKHRRAYYAAWTFLVQDTVHKLPESTFHYAQVLCGKPSLWNHGPLKAPGTAQWESLMGMQWLSYLTPDTAWSAFLGLMSLVDAEGKLSGESLPTRKAQTAWILYSMTQDRERLSDAYPALRRYLLWEEKNPRWIYESHNDDNERDFEFVTSWIYDASFAIRICELLGNTADARMWRTKQRLMATNARNWFYSGDGEIYQYFDAQTKAKRKGNPTRVAQGMGAEALPDDMKQNLLNYFTGRLNTSQPGAGFPDFKYPNLNLTSYGLLDLGRQREARHFGSTALTDAINGGTFGEIIEFPNGAPVTTGVQESLFSPLMIIEFTWLLNGCRYDAGTPVPLAWANMR